MTTHSHPEAENEPKTEPPVAKRLYRSTTDRMIAGVAGGIAEYLKVDPTIVRVLFIPFILLHGIGGAAYIIAWAVIPENPVHPKPAKTKPVPDNTPVQHDTAAHTRGSESSRRMFGILLLIAGAYFFLRQFVNFSFYGQFWPLLLVLIGVIIIFGRGRRS